jgi:hypothetical protein
VESVEEDEVEQMARQEQQQQQEEDGNEEDEERCRRRVELVRPRTPKLTGLGMTTHHLPLEDDEEPHQQQPSPTNTVIDQLFERLTTLSNQLKSAVELLQAQHAAAQSAISALESKVPSLETLVRTSSPSPIVVTHHPIVHRPNSPRLGYTRAFITFHYHHQQLVFVILPLAI